MENKQVSTTMETPSTEAKAKPDFPHMAMLSLCLGMLAHSVVFTSPLPYVAFMIVDFGMSENVDSAGHYAGWITGMFMIGRTLAGIPWGMASDTFGRKPCLMISMVNVAIFGLIFGFSTNFQMAIAVRMCIGMGNGFMGIAKTSVTEIVSCKEHEVRAFGILNGIWGLGLILGPAVGGLLSRPAIQYPDTFASDSLFGRYPYLLPSIVCSAFAVLALTLVALFLPETLTQNEIHGNNSNDSNNSCYSKLVSLFCGNDSQSSQKTYDALDTQSTHGDGITVENEIHRDNISSEHDENKTSPTRSNQKHEYASLNRHSKDTDNANADDDDFATIELSPLHGSDVENDSNNDKDSSHSHNNNNSHSPSSSSNSSPYTNLASSGSTAVVDDSSKPSTLKEIVTNKNIQFLFVVYMMYCFVVMYVDEVLPLWCVSSICNGGLSWTAAQVGELLAEVGFSLVIFQLFLYEIVIRKFFTRGPVDTFFRLGLVTAFGIALLPLVAVLVLRMSKTMSKSVSTWIIQASILSVLILYRTSATSAFSTLAIVVNGSVAKKMRGTINGLIMTAGSIGNAGGPILGSIIYAFMVEAPPPIDGRMSFLVASVLTVVVAFVCKTYMKVPE